MKFLMKLIYLTAIAFLCAACVRMQRAQPLNWKAGSGGKHILAERKLLNSVKTIEVNGPALLHFTAGANKNYFIVKGKDQIEKNLKIREKNGVLSLTVEKGEWVIDAALRKTAELKLNGLQSAAIISQQPLMRLKTFVRNVPYCVFRLNVYLLDITGEGCSKITVIGKTDKLVAHLKDTSQFNAAALRARDVKVKTYHRASAEVYPISRLFAAAMEESKIIYLHRPDHLFVFPYAAGNVLYIPRTGYIPHRAL